LTRFSNSLDTNKTSQINTQPPTDAFRRINDDAVKAYRIAVNRTGENSKWDFDLLPIEIGELHQSGFDCGLLGFDSRSRDTHQWSFIAA